MGYCPIFSLSHNTTNCIVTGKAWEAAQQACMAGHDTAWRGQDTIWKGCDTAGPCAPGLPAGVCRDTTLRHGVILPYNTTLCATQRATTLRAAQRATIQHRELRHGRRGGLRDGAHAPRHGPRYNRQCTTTRPAWA